VQAATALSLVDQLRRELAGNAPARPAFAISADRYRSEAWHARERARLFTAPRVALASSELSAPGSCAPFDADGVAALLVRGRDGAVRAFANACRHRATRLVDAPCNAKAITCPYHAWTYDLDGQLIHAPHADAFAPVELGKRSLAELPVEERHGLVWLGMDVGAYLGELDAELAALALDRHVAWRVARCTRRCNWKLVIEAFLDGYHIRSLHRDSIYRFFLDAASVVDRVGPHFRAVTARRALTEAPPAIPPGDVRAVTTPSLVLFPATVVIEHPDFVSIVSAHPIAFDACEWQHVMLVPAERRGETEHWDRSWALIEETVFQREDLRACEQIQRGLAAGSTDELLFGALEHAVRDFHATIDERLSELPSARRPTPDARRP
jgi:phenylpropionate dioxygenase-like ring-hydroxylating dioxygenase large terminal subunit